MMTRILIIIVLFNGCTNKITRIGTFSASILNNKINTSNFYSEYLRRPSLLKFYKAQAYQHSLDSLNMIYDSLISVNGDTVEIKQHINKLWTEYSSFTENEMMNRDHIPKQQLNFDRIVKESIRNVMKENNLTAICETDNNTGIEYTNNNSNFVRIDITDKIIQKIQEKLKL